MVTEDIGALGYAIEELKGKGRKLRDVILRAEYWKMIKLSASTLRTKKYLSRGNYKSLCH